MFSGFASRYRQTGSGQVVCGLQLKIMSTAKKEITSANKCAYTCALACSHAVKLSANNSACFNTVSMAFCCLSGG